MKKKYIIEQYDLPGKRRKWTSHIMDKAGINKVIEEGSYKFPFKVYQVTEIPLKKEEYTEIKEKYTI